MKLVKYDRKLPLRRDPAALNHLHFLSLLQTPANPSLSYKNVMKERVSRASSVGSLRSSLVFPFSVKRLTYKTSKTSVSLHQMKNRQLQESSLDPFHMSISTLVESSLQRSIASSLNVNVSTGPEILWGSKGIHQCKHSSQTSLLCKCTHEYMNN